MADERVRLTDAQRKAQRHRSIAIALVLVALVVIFYLVSMAKLSGQ